MVCSENPLCGFSHGFVGPGFVCGGQPELLSSFPCPLRRPEDPLPVIRGSPVPYGIAFYDKTSLVVGDLGGGEAGLDSMIARPA